MRERDRQSGTGPLRRRVGLVQMRCDASSEANLARAREGIAEAAADEEAVLAVECDSRAIEGVRRDWPFLRDRRVDACQGVSARYLDGAEVRSLPVDAAASGCDSV